MSGFEIVGLALAVLGVLPAAVEAVKGYKTLLSSIKHVERDLGTLIRDLETEQVRLRTTCEMLLDGVVPYSIIDTLIENPFGTEWQPYKDQLRLRLWSSSAKFEEHVLEMQKAAFDLNVKLNIQANGQTAIKDRTSILRELKQSASFSFKKKDYQVIIDRIKTSNSILHDLASQSCGMDSSRQTRSQARLIKLIRGLAKSLFHALWNATTCDCITPHQVCLELVPRKAVIVPSDAEEDVAKNFSFYVAFGSHGIPAETSADTLQRQKPQWNTFDLRIENIETNLAIRPVYAPLATAAPTPSKRVGWSASLSSGSNSAQSTRTLVDASRTLLAMPARTVHAHDPIANICRDIFGRQTMAATPCHGYITDATRTFGLYPRSQAADTIGPVTLRELLDEHIHGGMDLDFKRKLQVALAIATCVLHLYKTPWLPRVVTLDDFVFLRADVSLLSGPLAAELPFIAKSGLNGSLTPSHDDQQRRPVNLTILSLGALLIQVIVGRTIDELNMPGDAEMSMNGIVTRYEAGSRLRDRVLENGGVRYAGAVKWCLDNVFNMASLENEAFCQEFYNQIVVRLQEDVSYLNQEI
ncbi:hypothetical protein ISF_06445 [Cordyceps fumosorosea ARSEF 2679]|uniref:DUF7580 domain-containing protein n=1 Tax=Cordyceps fumosorosea (strain ARSEF 2679) TaxID=1081104 RepID=A0A167RJN3_CORFA|nr:hypothetical protein ISF_06445 [Cordyceps fumosorosea ARSEF 2679]OAA58662.1 hypothetical protein ISF_06445 [Cordyceps fumosorosea ARSEF 2679]